MGWASFRHPCAGCEAETHYREFMRLQRRDIRHRIVIGAVRYYTNPALSCRAGSWAGRAFARSAALAASDPRSENERLRQDPH
jgi:hypothetical protein